MRPFRPPVAPIAAALVLLAALPACTGSTPNLAGTAFPTSRMGTEARLAGLDTDGFTMRRLLGRPDGVEPLREDDSLARQADGRSLGDLLDVDGTRSNIFDQAERGGAAPPAEAAPTPPPRPRGSSSPPPPRAALPDEPPEPRRAAAPPPAVAPAAPLASGTVIPGPQGGTVVGGSAGSVATTVGPGGAPGTATRDGRTITLFGADGSIRTVPAPTR